MIFRRGGAGFQEPVGVIQRVRIATSQEGRAIQWSRCPGMTPLPMRSGPENASQPRPSGSMQPEVVSKTNVIHGVTNIVLAVSGRPILGKGFFRSLIRQKMDLREPLR